MQKKADHENSSSHDSFSDRGEDSFQTEATGSHNDSSVDLETSCYDDIVESLCAGSDSD